MSRPRRRPDPPRRRLDPSGRCSRLSRPALTAALIVAAAAGSVACERTVPTETIVAAARFDSTVTHPALGPLWEETPGQIRFGDGWWLPESGGLWAVDPVAEVQVQRHGRDSALELRVTVAPELVGQEVEVELDGLRLGSFTLAEAWRDVALRFPLPEVPAPTRWETVRFRAARSHRIGARDLAFFLRDFRIRAMVRPERHARSGPGASWEQVVAATEQLEERERPDLLIVLLDALRARQLGSYGYDRSTTPTLDSLATAGLRFTRAFATAPYTRCSVASLFTARSWAEHGVVMPGHSLPDSLPRIGEILAGAGYRCFGVTSNPNVSAAVGADRGFEHWEEVWGEDPRWNAVREVDRPEVALRRWLDAPADEKPVFAYVHLRPPHAPYDPDPEWNRWSDPDYDGPFDGGSRRIRRVNLGLIDFEPADAQHVRDLYDGLLRQVDATVDRILRHWRARRGDRPALVVILSDHGEALGERGLFGHNRNVYDELVHIPLIFSPHALVRALEPQRDELVAISDVLPMVLHVLEVPLPGGVRWPRRAVELRADPSHRRDAVLLRTTSQDQHFGLRTRDHLAVWGPWRKQELFELDSDSQQQLDIRDREPGLYARLVRDLVRRASVGSWGEVGEVTPDEEARARLRALGYLD